jgi:hypothetical protein
MIQWIRGTVHGRTIHLADDPRIDEGRIVEVAIRQANGAVPPGEGLRRAAGALADSWTDEDDRILREIADDRARSVSREPSH